MPSGKRARPDLVVCARVAAAVEEDWSKKPIFQVSGCNEGKSFTGCQEGTSRIPSSLLASSLSTSPNGHS